MIVLFLIIAYLLGSIPTSVWISKIFFNKDIRELGSGNAGATNMYRNFGTLPATIVLIIDVLKGFLATSLANNDIESLFFTILVTFGHIFPLFSRFKGGKGVATIFGSLIAINPILIIVPVFVFISTLLVSKISSLSSILASLSVPLYALFLEVSLPIYILCCSIYIIVMITHSSNMRRILDGEEKKLF